MTSLNLGLTLSIVGPRQDLLEKPKWLMALRVSIGSNSTDDSLLDWIVSTLPWEVWPDALPEVVIVDESGQEIMRCIPEAPMSDETPFLLSLKAAVRDRGMDLAKKKRLIFTFDGKDQEFNDTGDQQPVSWPGLMMTLNTLAQPTPSALKCTWFFYVDRDRVATQDGEGTWQLKAISAAPASVKGASYSGTKVTDDSTVHVHSYDIGGIQAYCKLLALNDELATELDELDNYWLSIRDSRDHSLLDLATRLETALDPQSILSALNIEELTRACLSSGADQPPRAATVNETKDALTRWKKRATELVDWVPNQRRRIISEALVDPVNWEDIIRQRYLEEVKATLSTLKEAQSKDILTEIPEDAMPGLVILLRDRLLPGFGERDPAPCRPGEGIELVLGDELMRLRAEFQLTGKPSVHAVDSVAAIQLFGRRSSDVAQLNAPRNASTAGWHALSGGRYAVKAIDADADKADWSHSSDRVLGVTAGYVDQVLCRELTYSGANLVCENPMQRVHRERLEKDPAEDDGFGLMQLNRFASPTWELRALPLRYGDHYEFAASVIDRAGGQAAELCKATEPWEFDPTSIARLSPPQRCGVHFLRRVPVGNCNILPPEHGWPQTPADVWLRCLEEAPPSPEYGAQPTSVLLVPSAPGVFHRKSSRDNASEWPSSVSFAVEAPRLDEHTLLRWNMPATTLGPDDQKAAVTALKEALTEIYRVRDRLLATDATLNAPGGGFPFDPAVTALGVSYHFDSGTKGRHIIQDRGVSITLECGETDELQLKQTTPNQLLVVIAPGSHVRLGLVPLIAPDDFKRMDEQALSGLLDPDPWRAEDGTAYRAFAESVIFAESASRDLPALNVDHLTVKEDDAGNVEVRYAFSALDALQQGHLRHVHQMRISCQRWVWRNLPVPAKDLPSSPSEQRRRLASGPPPEIVDPAARDAASSELVSYFDELAGLDQGFVRREEVILRFPRQRSDNIALHIDRRDGITAADYLRYHLTLSSRYQGVLAEKEGKSIGPRRIAMAFRGNAAQIKPPRVLAVLPLVRGMSDSPRKTGRNEGSAFLVILDEPWFREYGMGERLRARVAHVKAEVSDQTEPAELRFGPLPDHSVEPLKSPELKRLLAEDLDCFGPFGFSLDRGSSQAMANATGFVVYPPEGTPAHYNLFVEFSRLLDIPSGTQKDGKVTAPLASAISDAIPLYTLPDSDDLNPQDGPLLITTSAAGNLSFEASQVATAPFAGASGSVLLQYRYLLIVGRFVRDGGRAVDVLLPEDGLWMEGGDLRLLGEGAREISGCTAGVIAEVLLNGRPGEHDPLGRATDLRCFFKMMFDGTDNDSPGMIRRFSKVFDLKFRG